MNTTGKGNKGLRFNHWPTQVFVKKPMIVNDRMLS
jgi:hypothetical protein